MPIYRCLRAQTAESIQNLCSMLVVLRPWASNLTSLCFDFFSEKIGLKVSPS